MLRVFVWFVVLLTVLLCALAYNVHAADPLDQVKQSWANVPGGTVWLNPGDAYEHDSGLVRDQTGQRRMPSRPSQYAQPNWPAYPQPQQPVPYYVPQSPGYPTYPSYPSPQPMPYYAPQPVQPDYGPYMPPMPCPNCPPRRPSSTAWGVGDIDPMNLPKTGDAPRR